MLIILVNLISIYTFLYANYANFTIIEMAFCHKLLNMSVATKCIQLADLC